MQLLLFLFAHHTDNKEQWYGIWKHGLFLDMQGYHNRYLLWKYNQIHEWCQCPGALSLVPLMVIRHFFLLIGHVEATTPRIDQACWNGSSFLPHHCSSFSQLFSETQRFQTHIEYFQFIFTWLIKILFFRSHSFLRISTGVIFKKTLFANWLCCDLNEIRIELALMEYVDPFYQEGFSVSILLQAPYLHRWVSDEEDGLAQVL